MSDTMTWEQKFAAMQALGDCALRMRSPGNWYVSDSYEKVEGCMLVGETESEPTPRRAVEVHWDKSISGPLKTNTRSMMPDQYVIWNGFMWRVIDRETAFEMTRKQ